VNENGGNATDSGRRAHRRLHHRDRPLRRILAHLGEPAEPPRIAPARGLPAWEALAQPSPEYVFDVRHEVA
jgi:hypothetical protein